MDVLIVEDARDQRRLLCKVVGKLGYRVHEAEDGLQALQVLAAEPAIRVVISDWMMPNLDGIGLCEAIRSGQFNRYIYFILLTGKADKEAMVEGLSVGADDFLNKPVDYRELEVRLKGGQRVTELEQALDQKNHQLSKALDIVQQDLASAAETQERLLASPATIQNIGFDWHFKPSKILGGDMFGYHAVDDEHVMFYQLDVAGHGIPSALFSFAINNLLMDVDSPSSIVREQTTKAPYIRVLPPDEVVSRLNHRFQTTADNMLYFTMSYGLIHSPSGRVRLCHAGHPPTLWLRPGEGTVHRLESGGVPVGMVPGMNWRTEEFQLRPGDRLFLYSDGLTECENPDGEMFSEQRLCAALQDAGSQPMNTMISQVWSDLCQWRGGESFDDDMTGLVLEYQGE
ncbi:PP2C family protein-serine/threonine phosphatase [Parendozoicomonas haliclonae]|uniref:Phosphoserine phosphatase RsbP n=1 Tax=Parendozoicomonas haliclonae TaxID=1960125 RepID=A0A1X7AKZ1_9GAMM|nr:SpoIIE family protein phosphatase [Parendozoicomonas haliclonae]SMA47806.1 Phosphoserine phosphatase RsbP [Parendozoicomonas haliclonae]